MKIPVYEPKMPYQASAARDVMLARPLLQAYQSPFWNSVQEAGTAVSGVGTVLKAAQEEEDEQPRSPAKKTNKTAKTSARVGQFTDPARAELLQFGREKTFSSPDGQPAVEQLDRYVESSRAQSAVSLQRGADDLWAQDYILLRHETQQVQQQLQRCQRQEQWAQGEQHFMQTAALARSPQVLEQYIESNLSAADTEAAADGQEDDGWGFRREGVYTQAVRHNIESALACGETEQAQAVLRHFENRFSDSARRLLEDKILLGRAQTLCKKFQEEADAVCLNEAGEWNESAAADFISRKCGQEKALQAPMRAALEAQAGAQQRRILLRRAQQYEQLAFGGNDIEKVLSGGVFSGGEELHRVARALQQMQRCGAAVSHPDLFNGLYERPENAGTEEICQAFDGGSLSGKEFLSLYAGRLRSGAGEAQSDRVLLTQALERLGKEENWTEETLAQAKYSVYMSAPDMAGRWQAARRLRRRLHLQEEHE